MSTISWPADLLYEEGGTNVDIWDVFRRTNMKVIYSSIRHRTKQDQGNLPSPSGFDKCNSHFLFFGA